MSINYITGDATYPVASGHKIIAHVCNDIGKWGRGFVRAVSARWPVARSAYLDIHEYALGTVQFVGVEDDITVANMIAQDGIRRSANSRPLRYWALVECLGRVADEALNLGASVHMPRIGAGLAGGEWDVIEKIIRRLLIDHGVETFVYDLPLS